MAHVVHDTATTITRPRISRGIGSANRDTKVEMYDGSVCGPPHLWTKRRVAVHKRNAPPPEYMRVYFTFPTPLYLIHAASGMRITSLRRSHLWSKVTVTPEWLHGTFDTLGADRWHGPPHTVSGSTSAKHKRQYVLVHFVCLLALADFC